MKKIIIISLFLCAQSVLYAQSNMRFGVKGGPNFSTIIETAQNSDLSRSSTTGGKTSFHLGFVFEFLFSERISIQVESLYSAQGAKMIDSYTTADGSEMVRYLNYISFPILAKYYATPNFSIEVGPQVGLLLSARDELSTGAEKDILKEMEKHDFAINAGLAYEFYNGLFLQGRYSFGLLDINKTSGLFNYYKHRNNVVQFSVGYMF